MATKLQSENTDQLIYTNELLELTVLGGIRLDGLDRMRVTLKIQLQESSRPPQLALVCLHKSHCYR